MDQIESWLNEGFCAAAIAEKVGCTLGTLRVRCSQAGISLRRKKGPVAAEGCPRGPAETPGGIPLRSSEKPAATPSRTVFARSETGAAYREEHLVLRVARPTIHYLRSRAAQKGLSESVLATILLETIVQDDLYEAVLDEARTKANARTAEVLGPKAA
jgi:hypothetical protein